MDSEESEDDNNASESDVDDSFLNSDDDSSDIFNNDDADWYSWQAHGTVPASVVTPSTAVEYLSGIWPPLKADQFRVLEIEAPKSLTEPVSLKLVTRTLREPGEYFALSYTWGGEEYNHSVLCEETIIPITRNLHNALLMIRELFYSGDASAKEYMDEPGSLERLFQDGSQYSRSLYVWADAVCINQQNSVERSRQVIIMHQIFSMARHLLIWLGDSYEPKIRQGMHLGLHSPWIVQHVSDSPWFKRRWVIPEATLNVNKRSILSNGMLLRLPVPFKSSDFKLHRGDLLDNVSATTAKVPLLTQLLRYDESECRDPRDIVYALLNISSDGNAIVPDYASCVERVFALVAEHCVKAGPVLLLACAAIRPLVINLDADTKAKEAHECQQRIISWAPDWRLPHRGRCWGDISPITAYGRLIELETQLRDHTDYPPSTVNVSDTESFSATSHRLALSGWVFSECQCEQIPEDVLPAQCTQVKDVLSEIQCVHDVHMYWAHGTRGTPLRRYVEDGAGSRQWASQLEERWLLERTWLASLLAQERETGFVIPEERYGSAGHTSEHDWIVSELWIRERERLLAEERTAYTEWPQNDKLRRRFRFMQQLKDFSRRMPPVAERLQQYLTPVSRFDEEYRLIERYNAIPDKEYAEDLLRATQQRCLSCFLRVDWEIEKLRTLNAELVGSTRLCMLCLPHTDVTFLVQPIDGHLQSSTHLYRLVTCFRRRAYLYKSDEYKKDFMDFKVQDWSEAWSKSEIIPGYLGAEIPSVERIHIL